MPNVAWCCDCSFTLTITGAASGGAGRVELDRRAFEQADLDRAAPGSRAAASRCRRRRARRSRGCAPRPRRSAGCPRSGSGRGGTAARRRASPVERRGPFAGVDAGAGRLPGRGRIAVGAQLAEGRVLGAAPVGLAKRLAGLERARSGAAFRSGRSRAPRGVGVRGASGAVESSATLCTRTRGPGTTVSLRCGRPAAPGRLLDLHVGIEVALGLEQGARLRRRGDRQPVELGAGDGIRLRRLLEARQVEVARAAGRAAAPRRVDLELVERDLRLARLGRLGARP